MDLRKVGQAEGQEGEGQKGGGVEVMNGRRKERS